MHLKRKKITYQKLTLVAVAATWLQLLSCISVSAQDTDSDTASSEGYDLKYKLETGHSHPFSTPSIVSPLLISPSYVEQSVVYDPETNSYVFSEKIGSMNYRTPSLMSFEEYQRYQANQAKISYWNSKAREESAGSGPSFLQGLRLGNQSLDKVFGSEGISIVPSGSAELIFGYSITTNRNPQISVQNQRNGSFIFKEKIQMNVTGSIGDKMEVGLNYNTEASFDFENETKLEYTGKEDEIIKKIQAGDITFDVPGTLITGSQSLFGIRTDLQFGRLTMSSVLSNQRSESSTITVEGGAQSNDFEIDIYDYDANRHFFLSHFFRDNYNDWLENPQSISSKVNITSIQVWVVNTQGDYTDSRNIVALMDLGEGYGPDGEENFQASSSVLSPNNRRNRPTANDVNTLYAQLNSISKVREFSSINKAFSTLNSKFGGVYSFLEGRDYVKIENARLLSSSEYTVNEDLGYISLSSALRNSEALAVAFTYSYKGETKKVGELSSDQDSPNTLIVKLLKGTSFTPKLANWDLMMKNVYAIGAYQVSSDDFKLHVLYNNDETGVATNVLNEPSTPINGIPLLKVTELDNLDSQNEPYPDGEFDFVEGVTIIPKNGRIIFPLVEPFGSDLRDKFLGDAISDDEIKVRNRIADEYVFEELYDSTKTKAKLITDKNKFFLKGEYSSSGGSDIQLNAMNIPEGSVIVTAGGVTLTENVDYTVDYTLGRVKILNQGLLESGTTIKVSLESNSYFNLQQKTLLGTHLDYAFSENFNIGGTLMHLNERPLTTKVNYGEEAISNTIVGLNASYNTESQFLTTLVDKIPLIETKETSNIVLSGEFAQLIPGQSNVLGDDPAAYIDDFESAETSIELKNVTSWTIASPPQTPDGTTNIFYNGNEDGLASGYGRAKLSWYIIDPLFYGSSSLKPTIEDADLYSHYQREVLVKELFPDKDDEIDGVDTRQSVLNVSFYPNERGPYNYEPPTTDDNTITDPEERWGGMMREVTTTDFEAANIEYIEFWMMDPYLEDETLNGGDLYFQIGEISEDILRDDQKSYENGFPTDEEENQEKTDLDETVWGYVPNTTSLVDAFDNDADARQYQDVGLEGLMDEEEGTKHPLFDFLDDPSSDNFDYFLGDDHDANGDNILERYKNYAGLENNSPVSSNSSYTPASKSTPDLEDINDDNTLNTTETYFQYHVSLDKNDFVVGKNYIVDETTYTTDDNATEAKWYQFRIPISDYDKIIGDISDFESIRFLRLMMQGFDNPVTLRFATLEFVRSDWEQYTEDLQSSTPSVTTQVDQTTFEVSAVNIEENGSKEPVNYVLPPGVTRETDASSSTVTELNEQSLLLKVEDLNENDARAVYKSTDIDIRNYDNLEMFIHAEALTDMQDELGDHDVTAFVRLGSDLTSNYYEYEIPLEVTPPGTYNSSVTDYQDSVWPEDNWLDLELDKFVEIKVRRNKAAAADPTLSSSSVYIEYDSSSTSYQNRIKVKGNPSLSNVEYFMIGIRNPGDSYENIDNDGESKSAEVWFNELRLTGFNNDGGWAANAQAQIKLADLGTVNLAGSKSTPGYGSIDESTEERSQEEVNTVDASTNLELGKFFPEKANVSIPLYAGYSNTTINPEYYPGDPDRTLEDVLNEAETSEEKDDIKKLSQEKTVKTSINLTNVRWNKQFDKFKILQPSNFSASINYSNSNYRSYSTEYEIEREYGASLSYVYNNRPKNVAPFKKMKAVRKPAYRIIRDINFNYLPNTFTFNTNFDRDYETYKARNVYDDVDLVISPTTSRSLYWNRNYSLSWNFTRALKFDYTASNKAIIDEPKYDENGDTYTSSDLFSSHNQYWKDSVWSNIQNFGRNLQFNQQFGLSYTLPLNKIPLFNWTNIKASYDGTYSWTHGSIVYTTDDEGNTVQRELGHTLKNGNTIKLQGSFNMKNLYNKVGYFKNLDKKYSSKGKKDEDKRYKTVEYSKRTFFKKDTPKNIIHKLNTEDVEVVVTNDKGEVVKVNMEVVTPNKVVIEAPEDLTGATVAVTGKIEKGENPFVYLGENTIRLLLGLKNISLNYNLNSSTMLPGFLPETDVLGYNLSSYYGAPGSAFILGLQDNDINNTFAQNEWLTYDTTFSSTTLWGVSETFNYRSTFEPFKGFRIDLSGSRTYSTSTEQSYYNYLTNGEFSRIIDEKYESGNFTRSIVSIRTAFEKVSNKNDWESEAFNTMKSIRGAVSQRLSSKTTAEDPGYNPSINRETEQGYGDGYSSTHQDVLIYSFLAAYTGASPKRMSVNNYFSWMALPNWKLTFDGLTNFDIVQKYFKTVSLTHSYKSTYSIGSYETNSDYYDDIDANDVRANLTRDDDGDFISKYTINTVSINEQLSPLIGINMTWQNSLTTRFQYAKTRLLALSLTNQQITESRTQSFTVSAGYKFKDIPLKLSTAGGSKQITSDLNMRLDVTVRDNVTILRSLTESSSDQASSGTRKFVYGYTADYALSEKVNLQFYIDWNRSTPYVSSYYPSSEFAFGFSLRLSL